MHRGVVSVSPSASIRELAQLLRRHAISGVPVVGQGGAVVGMVSVTDLMWLSDWLTPDDADPDARARARELDERTVRDIMTPDVFGVEPGASLAELGRFFARTGLRRAVVLKNGELAGIVSVTDLLGLIADQRRIDDQV